MKKLIISIVAAAGLAGCMPQEEEKPVSDKRFHVRVSCDGGWSGCGEYYVDSVTFYSETEADLWTNGESMKVFGDVFKVFEINPPKN